MPQTTVGLRQPKWLTEGQYASTMARQIEGAILNTPNGQGAILPFGRVVHRNAQGRAVLPTTAASASALLLGVTIFNEKYGIPLATLTNPATNVQQAGTIAELAVGFPNDLNVLVETAIKGDIVMWTEEALAPGDIIAYRFDTASRANSQRGQIRKGFTAAAAGEQVGCENLVGARAVEAATANSLVLIRLGLVTPVAGFSMV